MRSLIDRLGGRFVPAVLTAAGATLLAAGLLTYTLPAAAVDPSPSPSPAAATPRPSLAPSSVSPSGGPSSSPGTQATATRVVIAGLDVDLPVMEGPESYPPCNVAMYLKELKQPGEDGAIYLYAHARKGMFLPLLTESQRDRGKRMLGMLVQVYTADDRLHLYEITEVLPHQLTLDRPLAATEEELWLQTSEGPKGTRPKLQVVARPLTVGPADSAAAHPEASPVTC